MTIYDSLRLLAATGCGIQIGGFLILSLFHKPLLSNWPEDTSTLWLFKRFYRFNVIIALITGILAIFAEARDIGFMLAILAMSYILLLTHLLPAMTHRSERIDPEKAPGSRRSAKEIRSLLKKLQLIAHFSQLLVLLYLVKLLTF